MKDGVTYENDLERLQVSAPVRLYREFVTFHPLQIDPLQGEQLATLVVVGIQKYLQLSEELIKFLAPLGILRVVRLRCDVALNLLDVIQGQVHPDPFALRHRTLRKIGIAEGFITNEIAFQQGQRNGHFGSVRDSFARFAELFAPTARRERPQRVAVRRVVIRSLRALSQEVS